ncbi:MAG: NAD(P)-dependent oxidoreductase [Silvibacterium sp.]|nr:NAD(P)-dependent oxidoreductase [Silvibacterium sp.]
MRVFVAGASGAIGRPLVTELIRQGHQVTGISRRASSLDRLAKLGATIVEVDVFDAAAVEQAVRESQAEAVIDELTSLPATPAEIGNALAGDRKVRIEGGGNLRRAAQAAGVQRYLQQASGFFLKATSGLATEADRLAIDAGGNVAFSATSYKELEERLFSTSQPAGTALRYGFFYGPGTWYHREGAAADQVRKGEFPIIGEGSGVWSFVHVEDAAAATVAALTAEPGTYNVVDSDPLPVSHWLPQFCRWVGAPPPPHLSLEDALAIAGPDAVYYGTKLCGAANEKARKVLNFRPRRLEWLV